MLFIPHTTQDPLVYTVFTDLNGTLTSTFNLVNISPENETRLEIYDHDFLYANHIPDLGKGQNFHVFSSSK